MLHLAHGTAISGTQLADDNQIFCLEVQTELYTDLEGVCAVVVVSGAAGGLGVAGGGCGLGRRGAESKTLYVLPLHRLRLEGGVGHGCGRGWLQLPGGEGCGRFVRQALQEGAAMAGRAAGGYRLALGQLLCSVSNVARSCDDDVSPITIRKWAKGGPQRLLD